MGDAILTSTQNPLIKQIRKLQRAKERRDRGLLLLEGTNSIEAACRWDYPLTTVCCTPDWCDRHPQLWQEIGQKAERIELVTPEVLESIATTVNPDGVVATAPKREAKIIPASELKLGLVLDRLQDPGNLGTIVRTAVATGVDSIYLSRDSVEIDNPKVLRASVGEWFRLPLTVVDNLPELIKDRQQQGVQIVATILGANCSYWDLDFTRPTLILLGNEGAGLSADLIDLADKRVEIPLLGGVESLNVAIAAAVLLYEVRRQKSSSKKRC
jgi:RNA methyltransferase, TrmH family